MISVIDDMPAGTLGFTAAGTVTDDDYGQTLLPALTEALDHGDVRLLYVLGDDFDSYSAGGALADTRLWLGHLTGWQKVAVATSHRWVHDGIRAFAWLMPGEVRVFGADEVDQAKQWLAEPAATDG